MVSLNYSLNEWVIYFIIYSFLGWLIESVAISIINGRIIHRGNMKGPFLLVYGFGAIFLLLFLEPLFYFNYKNKIVLFLISFALMTVWEYLVHLILELLYKKKWWDYSCNFLNIRGRVCLFYSLCWGFLGVVLITFLHPNIVKLVNYVKSFFNPTLNYLGYIFVVCFILDVIFSIPRAIVQKSATIKYKPDILTVIINNLKK
ncbi:MAG: putative ABC transporter permease [Bacilli bacterium]